MTNADVGEGRPIDGVPRWGALAGDASTWSSSACSVPVELDLRIILGIFFLLLPLDRGRPFSANTENAAAREAGRRRDELLE